MLQVYVNFEEYSLLALLSVCLPFDFVTTKHCS